MKKSRDKGNSGERELARKLNGELGIHVTRNLAQAFGKHRGELQYDLLGIPNYSIEVKRYASQQPGRGDIRKWWKQTIAQATSTPVLAYRFDHGPWRFVLPLSVVLPPASNWDTADCEHTVEVGLVAFCSMVREQLHARAA